MIVCCGEALIDMLPSPTKTGKIGFVPHSGGAVFNTAIALGRLGIDVSLLTRLSKDLFGEQLYNDLKDSEVKTEYIIRSQKPSTLAFVQLTDGHANYSFFDENSAGRMLSFSDFPIINDEVNALYFGGISLACEPAADAYATLCEQQNISKLIMVDPNIRPNFVTSEQRYRTRLEKIFSCADIIKISDEDLNWIYPELFSFDEMIEKLFSSGAKIILLTKGSHGAYGYMKNGITAYAPTHKVNVVDTVGAGDTFNAGVLAQLTKMNLLEKNILSSMTKSQLTQILEYGSKIASITVSRAGANPPWKNDL